jgi:hypothetical protein
MATTLFPKCVNIGLSIFALNRSRLTFLDLTRNSSVVSESGKVLTALTLNLASEATSLR